MEADYLPASLMHFSQVSLKASTSFSSITAEVSERGHGDWFVGKMKGTCCYKVRKSGYYSVFFMHLTLLAFLVGNDSSSPA